MPDFVNLACTLIILFYRLYLPNSTNKSAYTISEKITLNKILKHLQSDHSCVKLYVGSHKDFSLYHYNEHHPSQSNPHHDQNELYGSQ